MRRLLLGLLAAGCALAPTPQPAPPDPPAFAVAIDTLDGRAGLLAAAGSIELWLPSPEGRPARVTTVPRGRPPTVHLFALGGATGRHANAFVFGQAARGAAAVVVNDDREAVGGGLFVIALRPKDLAPAAISWQFLGPGEVVLAEGTGIRN